MLAGMKPLLTCSPTVASIQLVQGLLCNRTMKILTSNFLDLEVPCRILFRHTAVLEQWKTKEESLTAIQRTIKKLMPKNIPGYALLLRDSHTLEE